MIAAGYEDGNDADSLRHDPLFKLANGRQPDAATLCSQPTLSRLENTPGRRAPWWRSPARASARCRMGVFNRIFAALAGETGPPSRLMIDATHLKAHRTAASLLKKGRFLAASVVPRAG
jgi:hypothetical protein